MPRYRMHLKCERYVTIEVSAANEAEARRGAVFFEPPSAPEASIKLTTPVKLIANGGYAIEVMACVEQDPSMKKGKAK